MSVQPLGPQMAYLYVAYCLMPAMHVLQIPLSFSMGFLVWSQPLKSPTTLTAVALGAQTVNAYPPRTGWAP